MRPNDWLLRGACRAVVIFVVTLLCSAPAGAELIWDGDASQGTDVFFKIGTGNCEPPSTLTAVSDATHGMVWRYYKPSNSNRCENHGFMVGGTERIAQNEETWYLGWWSKLSTTANNNANFQWKSYGNHVQNFPLVLKMVSGQMTLMQRQPDGVERFIWRQRIQANEWNHYVLGIHVNSELLGGWVELWFNGAEQNFTDGSTRFHGRTLDSGNHNCPKWGVYGGSGSEMINWVGALRIGTAYEDVQIGANGSGGSSSGGGGSSVGGMGGAGDSGGFGTGGSVTGAGGSEDRARSSGGSTGGGSSSDGGTAPGVIPATPDSGCACRAVGDSRAPVGWLAVLALPVALRRKRSSIRTKPKLRTS
jgi:MYXO-CTERM domain-containing protein